MHRASNSNIPFKIHVLLLEELEGVEVGIGDDPVIVRDMVREVEEGEGEE